MADKTFKLEIVTPSRVVFNDSVQSFTVPGTLGSFQVLYNHAPILSSIDIGEVKLVDKMGQAVYYAVSGGFVEVSENKAVILAEAAERSDEIDVARAQAARDRAQKRIKEKKPDTDLDRARAALSRALNRLRVAQR